MNELPYKDAESLLRPIVVAIRTKGALAKWTGESLVKPVHHIALQPQELLDRIADESSDERVRQLVMLAFQFGVCQGYAMKKQEVSPLLEVENLLKRIEQLP